MFVALVLVGSIDAEAHNGNTIRGAVVDADGSMIDKFSVVVRPMVNKPVLVERRRFSKGIFTIDRLDRQKYEIAISAPQYIVERMNVEFPKNGGSTELKFVVLHPLVNEKYLPGDPDANSNTRPSDRYVSEVAKESYRQGVGLHRQGDFERALAAYGDAIRLAPNYASPLVGAGIVYLLLDRPEAALTFLKRAEELAPKDPVVRMNIAIGLMVKNDFRPAVKMLESISRENPDKTVPYLLLARVYYMQKKYSQAEKVVRAALQQEPDLLEARQLLLNMALDQKNYVAARENLMRLRDALNNELFSTFVADQIALMTPPVSKASQ
jgi:tetratricopeptide (TPR) repeat protein